MELKGLRICKVFGISIEIHLTWFFIFAFFVFVLATGYFPQKVPSHSAISYWFLAAIVVLVLFVCVIIHELAHSRVAQHFNISIKRITLMLVGGVAQLEGKTKSAKIEFLIAVAGPLSSFVLACIFWALFKFLNFGLELLTFSLGYLALINFILALFNLLPGYPMDGGRLVKAVIWKISGDQLKATKWATMLGKMVAILMILSGIFYLGFWLILIGFLLLWFGGNEYQHLLNERILGETRVKEAMIKFPFAIPPQNIPATISCAPNDTLMKALEKLKMAEHPVLYVVANNKPLGFISRLTIQSFLIFAKKYLE